jgi:hypothetical protein
MVASCGFRLGGEMLHGKQKKITAKSNDFLKTIFQ